MALGTTPDPRFDGRWNSRRKIAFAIVLLVAVAVVSLLAILLPMPLSGY